MRRVRYDQALAVAAILLAVAMAWSFPPGKRMEPLGAIERQREERYSSRHDENDVAMVLPVPAVWNPPSADGGRFDLFTPPVILIARDQDRLVLAPLLLPDAGPAAFELELLAIVQEPFRLQLVGYVGEPSNCLGVFENTATGETMLARAGHTFAGLGLRVEAFELRRERSSEGGSSLLTQWIAAAAIADLETGETIPLTTLVRRTVGPIRARLRDRVTAQVHEAPCGAELMLNGARFRVGAVRTDPPALELTRFTPDGIAETRWLTPET